MPPFVESCAEELRADRRHGGSWMARRAVEALVEVARQPAGDTDELLARLTEAGVELAKSRPAVGAIAGAAGRLLAAAHAQSHLAPDELARLFEEEAEAIIARRDRAAASIAIQLREQLREAFVLTHSASATVREALLHTPPERVTCTVSAPYEEGRSFADDLREQGLDVELVEDDEALDALERASVLLVGADTVFRDGSVCNKVGTRPLARRATELGVPTLVACETIKLSPVDVSAAPDELERAFDITEPEYVDLVATDEGTFRSDEIAQLVDQTPFLRQGYRLLRRA